MTDIIIVLCCILAGFLVGLFLKKTATKRRDIFFDAVKYSSALRLNVVGRQQEMQLFNAAFTQNCSEAFAVYLTESKLPPFFPKRQTALLAEFFGNLDCVSGEQLLSHLSFYQPQLDDSLKEFEAAAKKSTVYVKLGLLVGAMVGILFM